MKCLTPGCPFDAAVGIYCKTHASKSGGTTYFQTENTPVPWNPTRKDPDKKKKEKRDEEKD